jgi:ribosomal protein S18 acetylase RimI-like enzyme
MNPIIRNMGKADLDEVVQLHTRAFPDFFLTSLGENFLHELYKSFLLDDSTISKIIEKDMQIKGFVIGTMKPDSFFRKMLFHKWFLLLVYALRAFVKNPVFVSRKLLYALKYRGERPEKLINAALLSSVGVDPLSAKSGFGTLLIKAFCDEAFLKNASAVYLTTDLVENDSVNAFYLKNGFHLEGVLKKTNGRLMNRYVKFPDEKNY